MIEIRITKEIQEFEPKVIWGLTLRQLILVGAGAPVVYWIITTLSPIFTMDVAVFFCAPIAIVAYAFGWAKPYGMKMEKFIQSVFINRVLAPVNRKYKTENQHEVLLKQLANECRAQRALEEKQDKQKRKERSKRERYKLSPKAYK